MRGIDPDVAHDAVAVSGGEVGRHLGDLGEQVDVRRQGGDGAVEEQHVLDEQHQLFGHAGAVGEQGLGELADLGHELLGTDPGRVDRRAVEVEIPDHVVEVGVGGERPEVAEGGELQPEVVDRAAEHQAEEGQALALVQPPGDAMVEQADPTVGEHAAGCPRGGHRGRRRRAWRPRGTTPSPPG